MAQKEIDKNKIEFLLYEYSNFWMGVIRSTSLLEALKKLPEEMVLRKSAIPGLPPNMQRLMTVKDRIEEVERDKKVLTARLETTKKELENTPGGKKALENWKWHPSQDERTQ